MHRRTIYSADPDTAYPLMEILWDEVGIIAHVRAGKLDVAAIGPMFKKALGEIQSAIIKGKANATE